MKSALDTVRREIADSIAVKSQLDEAFCTRVATLAERIAASQRAGGKLLVFGNGGSAADSQHMAAELIGRFVMERAPLRALALTTNTSSLTALANDYDYDRIFARQVEAWAAPGDVALGISTSGNSRNVLAALTAARERGAFTAALTGAGGGAAAGAAELLLAVPSKDTARIQECHILAIHIVCGLVERALFAPAP